MYFLFVLFLLAALTCFTLEYWRKVRYWQRRHVPCPRQHWLWGNMEGYKNQQSFNDIFHEFYKEFRQTTLPLLGVYIFVKPVALITDIQLAKRILTKDFSYFHDRGLYHNPDDLTGNLFTLDYDKWKVFRTNLSPSFTSGKLKRMQTTFVTTSNVLIEVMEQDIMGGDNILDIKDLMLRYTLEIVGACGFGCQTHSLQNPKDQFYQLIQNTFIGESNGTVEKLLILAFPKVARFLKLQYLPANMIKFYTKFVKDLLESRKGSKVQYNYIIDILNEIRIEKSGRKLTLNEITAQTLIFYQAGYESAAFTLTYSLYELARNGEVQKRARDEIISVLQRHNNQLTYECLSEMKYLEQVLKEILRLYPVSPLIIRQCSADYPLPTHPDIIIAKGQMVIIPAYSFQRDENYFHQADTFNPDNFAADRSDSSFLLSFGEGPRNCIGMRFAKLQMTVGLILLLSRFSFSFCDKTENPIVLNKKSVLLTPQNGIYLKVEKYQQ